jgi:hypothetical protein
MMRNVQLEYGESGTLTGDRSAMQTVTDAMKTERNELLFSTVPQTALVRRLAGEFTDAAREFARGPLSYLRAALLPRCIKDWLPLRFLNSLLMFIAHPLSFTAGLFRRERIPVGFIYPTSGHSIAFVTNATGEGQKQRGSFARILVASGLAHAIFIGVLVYLAIANMFAPFSSIQIVSRPYRRLDPNLVAQLYARPQEPRATSNEVTPLEELRERERKRREEAERRKREEAARERAAREKAEREKAAREKAEKEAQANAGADAKKEEPTTPAPADVNRIEINETPLKEIIGKVYDKYKAGGIDLTVMNFTVMATFKIESNGTLSNTKITQSSGSKVLDDSAMALLYAISESHALGIFSSLSSGSIRFDLTQDIARLTITAFAPSASQAETYATLLRGVALISGFKQENPDTKELLSLLKIKTNDKRIDAELMTSRARATQMMHTRFDKPSP